MHNRNGDALSEKTYRRDRTGDVTLKRSKSSDGGDGYEVCICAPLPYVETVRSLDVRRRVGDTIVSAIREGLKL